MPRTVLILQARMGSSRLPGKVLKPVLGKPLLLWQIERLKLCREADAFIIATSTNPLDDVLEQFARSENIPVSRGSEEDVLSRFYHAALTANADIVVRLTADCPLIDPEIVDSCIRKFKEGGFDYVSNSQTRTFPRGLDTEVFSFTALKQAFENARETFEREHVTPYLYNPKNGFRLGQVTNGSDLSHHRWTVDTPEDFELIRRLLTAVSSATPSKTFLLKDFVELLKQHPEWEQINAHIHQKELTKK